LNTVATATAHLRDMGNSVYTESADGSLTLESGDLLIQPSKKTTVHFGQASVAVEPNSMVLITKEGSTIKIANVWERQTGSARIHIGERFIPLCAGREAIITASTKDSSRAMKDVDVARRRIKESKCGGLVVTTADVSIHSLLRSDRVLNTLVRSTKSDDKAACNRIIKMAAVLTMATSGRGKYETAAGN